jgi:hypothetical protein
MTHAVEDVEDGSRPVVSRRAYSMFSDNDHNVWRF